MNIYRLIVLIVTVIIAVHIFDAKEAVTAFLDRIFDIPQFTSYGSNEPIFKLAVRAIYLITLVGIVKLIVNAGRNDSE